MSYCRWSSDNFRCDLYCYADVNGGYTTHVASNRVLGDIPEIKWPEGRSKEETDAFMESYKAQSAFLDNCGREDIGLPYDGQTFNDADLKAFRDRLVMLREAGYNFPDYVLEMVDEEIVEENASDNS